MRQLIKTTLLGVFAVIAVGWGDAIGIAISSLSDRRVNGLFDRLPLTRGDTKPTAKIISAEALQKEGDIIAGLRRESLRYPANSNRPDDDRIEPIRYSPPKPFISLGFYLIARPVNADEDPDLNAGVGLSG